MAHAKAGIGRSWRTSEATSPVHVAFACDLRYLQPLTVALRSVVETARNPRRLHFWVAANTADVAAVEPAAAAARDAGSAFTLLPLAALERFVHDLPARGHISTAAYYRLFLPEILPPHVRRFVYLDCDLVVCRAIEDLWATDLGSFAVAAVMKPRAREFADVGLQAESDYFNSGVMLIDVPRWCARGIRPAALEFAAHHPGRIHGHDQPALNHVLAGQWHHLDLRWNQQFKFFAHTASYLGMDGRELRQLRREPFIVHYTTSAKPWQRGNDHPLQRRYFEMLDRTAFAGWRPDPGTLRQRLGFFGRRLIPHHLRPHVLRNVYRPHYHAFKERLGLGRGLAGSRRG